MADKAWKRHERETARLLGGQRHRVTGLERGAAPDVEHDHLSIECKLRDKFPKIWRSALDQAEASSKNSDKVPIAVYHESGTNRDEDIVMMKLKHFIKISWWEE